MAEFDVEDVTRIAKDAAREQSPTIKVAGVLLAAGGTDYVEILINLEGCHAEPCQLSLGVFRNGTEVDLKNAIADQLRRHLDQKGDPKSAT